MHRDPAADSYAKRRDTTKSEESRPEAEALHNQEKTVLVEGVMRRGLRELPIGSFVAMVLAAVALVGCAARIHVPFVPGDSLAGPMLILTAPSEFADIDSLPHPAYVITAEDAAYRTTSLAFPSAGENGQAGNLVTARYSRSKSKGAKPLVIVLPIWGIETYPSNTISAGLKKHGGNINVLQIDGERPLLDWDAVGKTSTEAEFFDLLDQMIGRFVSTVIDIRRVVDWAQTQPDVDPQRIALIGFSMGALVASVAIANEPRLAAGVLVMGGADPHEILAACGHEIGRGREHVLEHLDWSLDQYRNELAKALARLNPARFAGMVDPRRVLIIEAAADTCVPQTARERLWQAMGRPERIAYLYDHRAAFLAMTFLGGNNLQQQIYRFLDRRFSVASDPAAFAEARVQDKLRPLAPAYLPCGGLEETDGGESCTDRVVSELARLQAMGARDRPKTRTADRRAARLRRSWKSGSGRRSRRRLVGSRVLGSAAHLGVANFGRKVG